MKLLAIKISILLVISMVIFPGYSITGELERNLNHNFKIISIHPHDSNSRTEGLQFIDGFIYEGTGPCLNSPSGLRKIRAEDGGIVMKRNLPIDDLFGDGITIINGRIIELTYKTHIGFVYDSETFELIREFYYPTEGWGITNDGENLIMSDGTSTLRYLDPETFNEVKHIEVTDNNGPVSNLNELEYINGEIYANILETSRIVAISPETGRVTGSLDLSALLKYCFPPNDPINLANGIAYDPEKGRLFVTGKYWSKIYEFEMIDMGRRHHRRGIRPQIPKPEGIGDVRTD